MMTAHHSETGQQREMATGQSHWRWWAALPLLLLAILLAATNEHFDILDDEVLILNTAAAPFAETLHTFASGVGQHEHPPLSDLLLHAWWRMVPGSPFWLRLPFIVCYVGAFWILVLLVQRLAGPRAAVALAWLTLCSPYGFHFGRQLGWYNVTLLLVAGLTYCYARWLEGRAPAWAAATLLLAVALLYTNYFGWVLIGLLLLDSALFQRTGRWRAWLEALGALLLLAVAFGPLWPAFYHLHQRPLVKVEGSKLAAYIFDMYALLVSESFAPWFFAVGVPVALLCVACYVLTLLLTRGLPRRLYVLALIGSISTKRLPFLTGWLFLAMAVAITQSARPRLRRALIACVAVVFAVGWFGTFHRGYYASTHFVDDWKSAVAVAMREHAAGGVLLYDQRVGSYYLNRTLKPGSQYRALEECPTCGAEEANAWLRHAHPAERVVVLRGVQYRLGANAGDRYLEEHCRLKDQQHFTRDTAAALKERLFPTQREPEWRIAVEVYDCPSS
jgi:Dolichyl-phosphate-mannose-protein mannosyltransferase